MGETKQADSLVLGTEDILTSLCNSVTKVLGMATQSRIHYSGMVQRISRTCLKPDIGCFVLFDGGIRRGADIVKALALGASCCLIARPQLWGLAVAGEAGVAQALDILRREMARVMALLGAATVGQVTREVVVPAV
jgi:hypothetical protein